MNRIPSLDGLRAISILLVLVAHSRFSEGFPVKYADLARHGGVGVTVFFVISGFLITFLLLNEQEKTGRISLKQFYINRVLRILPVFLFYSLFIIVLKNFKLIGLFGDSLHYVFTFTVNFDHHINWYFLHFWSLSVEEQFYVFWPAILLLFNKHLKTVLIALIMYSCFARVIAYRFPAYAVISLSPFFNYSDAIFTGALGGAVFFKNPAICRHWVFRSYWLQMVALILIIAFVYFTGYGKLGKVALPFGNIIISASVLFLIFSYITPGNPLVFNFLNSRILVHIGILSYSIYIWQQFFFVGKFNGLWPTFPVNILVIYFVSLASYYLLERPFLRLRKQFSDNKIKVSI